MLMSLEWSRFSPVWYEWLIGHYCNSLANQIQTVLKFRNVYGLLRERFGQHST